MEINYSPTGYDDALPAEVMQVIRAVATVKSMTRVDGGFRLEDDLHPGRAINIDLGDSTGKADFMYLLWQHEVIDVDEKTHIVRGTFTLPDDVPDAAYFEHWVKQSVNQAALELFTKIERQLAFAARLNAVVGSRSEITYRAVQKVVQPQSSIPVHTANTFLNVDLPVLAGVSAEEIMRLRKDEGEAFQRFRLLLDQKLSSVREKDNLEEAERAAEYAVAWFSSIRLALSVEMTSVPFGCAAYSLAMQPIPADRGPGQYWIAPPRSSAAAPDSASLQNRRTSKRPPPT